MCLKNNFKIFRCNPSDPEFDINKFLGEINFYVTKLCKSKVVNKAVNKVNNKITDYFEKLVVVTKSKKLKRYAKNILPNYKKQKAYNQK